MVGAIRGRATLRGERGWRGQARARLTIERVVTTLLHDAIELLRVDLAIAITVSLVDHILR